MAFPLCISMFHGLIGPENQPQTLEFTLLDDLKMIKSKSSLFTFIVTFFVVPQKNHEIIFIIFQNVVTSARLHKF